MIQLSSASAFALTSRCWKGSSPPYTQYYTQQRSNIITSPLHQFTTSSSEFDKDYSKFQQVDSDEDAKAKSDFGT